MASKVEIVNLALRGLGGTSIASLDENSENARKMKTAYPLVLKGLLRIYPWSFAKKESALSQLSVTPILTEYTYVYSLPSDFIRLLKTDVQPDYTHKIKGKRLYSNANVVNIEYIYYCDDPVEYDSAFVVAFASALSVELAYAITGDKNIIELKRAEYQYKLNIAKSANGQEVTPDEPQADDWLNSRV